MSHYPGVRVPTRADVEAAARRLAGIRMSGAGRVCRTPMLKSAWLSERAKADVWLKIESVQPGASFKIRGALNALQVLHSERPDVTTVVTASAGNHGTAMAIAARHFGLRLRVHLSVSAPDAKRTALLAQGAELVEAANYDEAEAGARADAAGSGAPYISPYNHPDVIAGAGTVALEMLEDEPALTAIVVPLGGGGLLAGAALVARGHSSDVRVIGAEAERSPVFTAALATGEITTVTVEPTLADGLAGNLEPASQTFDLVRDLVDAVALVAESSIETAMRSLIYRERLVSEGAGATAVAALLQGGLDLGAGPVGVMLTGRNVDEAVLRRIL
jgi:threonine dehydratase